MKKLVYLVAPIMCFSTLVSCGGNNKPVDIHIVSEQEFYDACSFKDIKFVKSISTEVNNQNNDIISTTQELSPSVYHISKETSNNLESALYTEIFTKKDNDSYENAFRYFKDDDYYTFEVGKESDFVLPQSDEFSVLKSLEQFDLKYSDFVYDQNNEYYSVVFNDPTSSHQIKSFLTFENKKLIKERRVGDDFSISTTYSYNETAPTFPDRPVPDAYRVNETEFNNACSFVDTIYLQINGNVTIGGITYTSEKSEFSPSVFYELSDSFEYSETYVKRIDNAYKKANRNTKSGAFTFGDATASDLHTPQEEKYSVLKVLEAYYLSYRLFKYNKTNNSYECTVSNDGESNINLSLKFYNKQIISYTIDSNSKEYGSIRGLTTYTYDVKSPKFPLDPTDTHAVNKEEFEKACSFDGVSYLQVFDTKKEGTSELTTSYECSPTVSRMVIKGLSPEATYFENFVSKNGDSYESAIRHDDKDYYVYKEATATQFVTPQSDTINVLTLIQRAGLSYDDFDYDFNKGCFAASFEVGGQTKTLILDFNNKKLVGFTQTIGSNLSNRIYNYNEETPTYPTNDSRRVTKQEFEDACSFKDLDFLQIQGNIYMDGVAGVIKEEFSNNVYYTLQDPEQASIHVEYVEGYVLKKDDGSYEAAERDSEDGDYSFGWTDESQFKTPQSSRLNVLNVLLKQYDLSFYSFTFDEEKGVYKSTIGSEYEKLDFELKFENKKLVNYKMIGTLGDEIVDDYDFSYTYDEVSPIFPTNYKVSEEEFNNACNFKDISYVQNSGIREVSGSTEIYLNEYSESVYRSRRIKKDTESDYNEIFVKKNSDENYRKATREEFGGVYSFENVDSSEFLHPQDINVAALLKQYGLTYNSFTYGPGNRYTKYVTIGSDNIAFILIFENLKLVSFRFEIISGTTTTYSQQDFFTYNETTPEFPPEPSR